ncbi:MAG TPA: hypothetical protein PLR26_07490 [Bacilli bacterium]|nr:hypothetical protein [Bacilli bacterium]
MFKFAKPFVVLLLAISLLVISGCTPQDNSPNYEGTYTGYAWKGEVEGIAFENATEYIETILTLDKNGVITEASVNFFIKRGENWTSRINQTADVIVDFNVIPTQATLSPTYVKGDSMFTIQSTEMMSFYASAVSNDGIVAFLLVEPTTRFQYEVRLDSSFDYQTTLEDFTIGNGFVVPTVRTAGGALVRPTTWDSLQFKGLFNTHGWSKVMKNGGVFASLTQTSTVEELLTSVGITFVDGLPQAKAVTYGYFGVGGWAGNYAQIGEFLIGKNATEYTSLIDWTIERYANGIGENNFFGTVSGATQTVQDSTLTISGATVRVSRESASYQRALVEAGILQESQVIKGRF